MSDRALRSTLALFALAGAVLSAYLVSVRYGAGELICSTGGCETVQSSPYAEVAGAPVALLGLGAYLAIAAMALVRSPQAHIAAAVLALTAVVFSGYLLVVQLAVIDAVCDWCLANDVLVTLVAGTAVLRLRAV
jgi:uncharacterized membrane protein